jgi:hypothetical protein
MSGRQIVDKAEALACQRGGSAIGAIEGEVGPGIGVGAM